MTVSTSTIIKKLLVVIMLVAGLYFARQFFIPLAIAGVLATLFLPFCQWMEGKKVPRAIAVLICILTLLLVLTGIGALLTWQVSALSDDFAILKQKAIDGVAAIQQFIFDNLGISLAKQSAILLDEQPSYTGLIQSIVGSLASIVGHFVLILAYVFGLLYYRGHIHAFILNLTPVPHRKEMAVVVDSAARVSQQYLVGLAKMIVCLWIMYGIGFSVIGIKNALLFAVLCGLLEIIPFIGNITGTTVTVLVSMGQGASFPMLISIVVVYGVIQFIQGWVLEPLLLGPQVKINPFAIILALVVGELVWGIPGIFLAIPLMAMFKIVCDHIESLKPLGLLIGEVEPRRRELGLTRKIKHHYTRLRQKR